MEQIVIAGVDTKPVEAEQSALVKAADMPITTQEEHAAAGEFLKRLAGMKKRVVDLFGDAKKAAHDAHKAIVAAEKKLLDPIDAARSAVSRQMDGYEAEQRRIAEQRRRELEEQARREEEERQLQDAIAAEEAGDTEMAAAIMEEPVVAPVVHVAPAVAKTEGVVVRTVWRGEGFDLLATVRHVAAHPEDIGVLAYDTTNINQRARAQRGELNIPGVRAVAESSRSVRA